MRLFHISFSGFVIAACVGGDGPSTGSEELAATCAAINTQSMIETDPAIVTDARFSLQKVFSHIRTSTPAGVTQPSSSLPMFQELYAAFSDCTSSQAMDPNHYGISCRPDEASVASLNPFTTQVGALHYSPVALVNRFDLAAADGSTCGESRIVFWKQTGLNGRAAIIVEMRTPPVVTKGVSSCTPVANFWASLSSITDPTTRATKLESFFFNGLPGMAFPPASAQGVGFSGAGQVRLNSFVNNRQWNLREFKWKSVCAPAGTCSAHFVEQTVKNNPSQLLFSGAHSKAPGFQSWFVSTAVPALASATDVNELALPDADGFNTFESVSEPFPGDPTNVEFAGDAEASLTTKVQAKLTKLGSSLKPQNIYDRATTQTCGGCHEVSNLASLGGGLSWPSSAGFVQIDEQGNQSPAESGTFIPHRIVVLEDFLGCGGGGAGSGSGSDGSGSGSSGSGSGIDGSGSGSSGNGSGSDGEGSGSSGNGSGEPLTIDGKPLDSAN
jgi:hypothetical protein